jgi:hypothetical protein
MPFDTKAFFSSLLSRAPELASRVLPDCEYCEAKAFPNKCLKCGKFVCINHGFFSSDFQVICDNCVEDSTEKESYGPWDLLGISADATEAEIKKAFKERSRTFHPDHGGSETMFKRLNKAKDEMLAFRRK